MERNILATIAKCLSRTAARHRTTWSDSTSLQRRHSSTSASSIVLGRHVREALANGSPVVALESTVITHGLPSPQNLSLALELERDIAEGRWWAESSDAAPSEMRNVVTPATVGVIKGQLVVGLSRDQLEFLATAQLSRPIKASRRDLPIAQALGLSAGTTVSATMAIATSCRLGRERISVFATGGLGGVHLGGELSMDVSADLCEMARSPIGLVSSGFKSFLDTPRSLELLETLGCTVASLRPSGELHRADEANRADRNLSLSTWTSQPDREAMARKRSQPFPGFFSALNKDGVKSPWQCDSVQEAAHILYFCIQRAAGPHEPEVLQNPRSMLLACPIPARFDLGAGSSGGRYSSEMLARVSREIDARPGLSGPEKTPLILAELNRLSGGETLKANLELLRNNSRVGAHLAYEYAKLCQRDGAGGSGAHHNGGREPTLAAAVKAQAHSHAKERSSHSPEPTSEGTSTSREARGSPLVIGCTMIDMHVRTQIDAQFKASARSSGVTFAGEPHMTLGGVGRNLAAALELLGHAPTFVTALAGDNLGEFALGEMRKLLGPDCESSRRLRVLDWRGEGAQPSSCFALVLIDSLTGQCEYVVANLEAKRAISRRRLMDELLIEELEFSCERRRPPLVVLDANLADEAVACLLEVGHRWRVPVFMEPTDVACLAGLVANLRRIGRDAPECLRSLAFLSPNAIELREMVRLFDREAGVGSSPPPPPPPPPASGEQSAEELQQLAARLMEAHLPHLKCLLVTMDKRGVLVGARTGGQSLEEARLLDERPPQQKDARAPLFRHFEPDELITSPVSASGAGDCFAAGFIGGLLGGAHLAASVRRGFKAATCALRARATTPESLRELANQQPNVVQ